ncbi:MAG: hypothetical protein ACOC7V_07815 [Spirochaetota bacterium]
MEDFDFDPLPDFFADELDLELLPDFFADALDLEPLPDFFADALDLEPLPDFFADPPDFDPLLPVRPPLDFVVSRAAVVLPLFFADVPDFPVLDLDEAAFVEVSFALLAVELGFFAELRVLFFFVFFVFRPGYFSSHSRKNCFTPFTPSRSKASTQPVRNSSASARASSSVRFVP